MFIRKRIRLAFLVAIAVTAALSTGSAAPVTGSSTQAPSGVYTKVTTAFNGVQLSSVNLPGIPGKIPIQAKPGGKISLPCQHQSQVNASTPSTASASACSGPQSHDYFFQWWMGIYNASHSLMYEFSEYYDWTGNGNVVSYFQTDCWHGGGYWTFINCSTDPSDLGRRFVKTLGNWAFGCCQNNYWTYNKYPHAEVTATADGTISGTVYSG